MNERQVPISFAGGLTEVLVSSPATGDRPRGLVLNLHGSGAGPDEQLVISGLGERAADVGFVVATPCASIPLTLPTGTTGWAWNLPGVPTVVPTDPGARPRDEFAFLDAVRDQVGSATRAAGPVAVVGFSGGARMACAYADHRAGSVTALVAVAGLRAPASPDGGAVPVLAIHGTDDPVNPYDGVPGDPRWTESVPEAARRWTARNGGATVELHTVPGGGHDWPVDPDATALICAFLERLTEGSLHG